MASKPPYKAGARVAIMPNGSSLVPGIVLAVWQGDAGRWIGDVRTADGLLENRSMHPDFIIPASALQQITRDSWAPTWERLAKDVV
jgi:hypothetical protein